MADRHLLTQVDTRPLPPKIGAEDLSWRDKLSQMMTRGAEKIGVTPQSAQAVGNVGYGAGAVGETIRDLKAQDVLPGISEASSMYHAVKDWGEGNYGSAGINLAGAIPFAGKGVNILKNVAKAGEKEIGKELVGDIAKAATRNDLAKAASVAESDAIAKRLRDQDYKPHDPYAPTPVPENKAVRSNVAPGPGPSETPKFIMPEAKQFELPKELITRPEQERSGVFDYDYKMPVVDSGLKRHVPKNVPERTTDLLSRPDVFDKMVEGVERGLPVKDWYEMGPAYKSFVDTFGKDEGDRRFKMFTDALAATSPRSDVGTNIRNATYYYGQALTRPGQNSLPTFPDKPPFPYGHLAQNLHKMNAEKTLLPGGAGFDYKDNAKPGSFAANFRGDPNVVTVDTHAFRAPAILGQDPRFLERSFLNEKGATPRNIENEYGQGMHTMEELAGRPGDFANYPARGAFWQSKPKVTEYAAYEDYYRKIAQELGITPAEAQAAGWVGHGPMTGLASAPKSAMDFIEERVLKTARERNMSPKDVWNDAITGKAPLLQIGGAAAVGGAGASILSQPGEQKQEY